jgi:hypothetical protein
MATGSSPTVHYPDGTTHVPHFERRRALPEIERQEGTTVLNARLGDPPVTAVLQTLADAIDNVRN